MSCFAYDSKKDAKCSCPRSKQDIGGSTCDNCGHAKSSHSGWD